jgi:hypothetical protein
MAAGPEAFWRSPATTLEQKRAVLSWVMTPYLYPASRPGGRVGFEWRNGGPPVMAALEVRPAQVMYERVCERCGTPFEGRGRFCGPGCYPSRTPEVQRAAYAAGEAARRKAKREAAGPGSRALKRQAVLQLLAGEPGLPDREIAARAGVSTQAVWKIRRATPGTRPSRPWRSAG